MKKVLGENHPLYAASLSNLAMCYYHEGNYAHEPLVRQALEIRRKTPWASPFTNIGGRFRLFHSNHRPRFGGVRGSNQNDSPLHQNNLSLGLGTTAAGRTANTLL